MNFLFLTTIYPTRPGDSYMTSELASALRAVGDNVDVIVIDWNAEIGADPTLGKTNDGINVLTIAPRALSNFGQIIFRCTKILLSSFHARKLARKTFLQKKYDVIVAWTPATAIWSLLLTFPKKIPAILFIYDFYPIHQREIGLVPPGPVFWVAKAVENFLYRRFSAIICNLPGNVAYLRKNYRIATNQRVSWTPLWSITTGPPIVSREKTREAYGLPPDSKIAVFGGQIVEGRGVDFLLNIAERAADNDEEFAFLFVGDGRLAEFVDEKVRQAGSNVFRIGRVPRDNYLEILSVCDIGMAATVPNVSSYSFPTKSIDYLRAGLPVIVSVEPGNDVVSILTNYGVGCGVAFGDIDGYLSALRVASTLDRDVLAKSVRRCLDEVFDVRHGVTELKATAEAITRLPNSAIR